MNKPFTVYGAINHLDSIAEENHYVYAKLLKKLGFLERESQAKAKG